MYFYNRIILLFAISIILVFLYFSFYYKTHRCDFYYKLGVGINVDWMKYKNLNWNKIIRDFKLRGFDHVRIRIKEINYSTSFLLKLKNIINISINNNLIPIVSFKAQEFKEHPQQFFNKTINFWIYLVNNLKDFPDNLAYDLIIEPSKE